MTNLNYSIIVPTCNRQTDLARLIDSILKQTLLPAEVIIIDQSDSDDTKKYIDSLPNQALSNIKREYICLVINSIAGQSQIERDSGGSVINHWKPSQVQETLIPVLPDKIQEKIELLCLESHSARRTAKGLLEEAKGKVEEMIEKE